MELTSSLKLEQKQLLTWSQIQSLEILSMSAPDLNEYLRNEYMDNPMLDYTMIHPQIQGQPVLTYSRDYNALIEDEDRRIRDIPYEKKPDIKEYIIEQLPAGKYSDSKLKLIEFLIDSLDDTGFFTMDTAQTARLTGADCRDIENILEDLRELEPYGIFSPDLRECLLKQIDMDEEYDEVTRLIVDSYLDEVLNGKIGSISRALNIPTNRIRMAIENMAAYSPRPMRFFSTEKEYIINPDVIVSREGDDWSISLNDNWIENYSINDYYLNMMQENSDRELQEYFQMKLERARMIMNSIAQRRNTLINISREIAEFQEGYLLRGEFLKPMTMSGIADKLNISVSTVSRAVKGKYMQYKNGTAAMKDLFSVKSAEDSGGELFGAERIKSILKEMIESENPKRPYSDANLAKLLEERNIRISRRAIAKYREEIGIPGSFERKSVH